MPMCDWSSDVCSSDLLACVACGQRQRQSVTARQRTTQCVCVGGDQIPWPFLPIGPSLGALTTLIRMHTKLGPCIGVCSSRGIFHNIHMIVRESEPQRRRRAGVLYAWNSPGQNTGVGSHSLLQGIFLTQGLNPGLPHCGWILYHLSHQGSPRILKWVTYPFSSGSSRPRNRTWVSCIAGRFSTS